MADSQEQTGEGAHYDTNDNELANVRYRVEPQSPGGASSPQW